MQHRNENGDINCSAHDTPRHRKKDIESNF